MDNLVTNRVASCFLRPLGMTGMTARSNPAPPTGGASLAPPRSTARRGIAHLREREHDPLSSTNSAGISRKKRLGGLLPVFPYSARLLSLIHISEPTRLRRISYAVFCLKKK